MLLTLIDSFNLTIHLGVIGSVEIELSSLDPKQLLLEIGCEGGVMVHDNSLRHTMEFKDIIYEDLSYHRGLERVL